MPAWLNWTNFLIVWSTLWALSTALQNAFPVNSWPWRICHFILGISPGDFIKAAKSLGGSLVPPTGPTTPPAAPLGVLLVLLLASHELACSASPPPAPLPPPGDQAEVAMLGSQLQLCVAVNQSRAGIDACKASVNQFWCGPAGPLNDAGACVIVDGGVK